MIDEGDRPWALGNALKRARQRCVDIAESERIMGYEESSRVYWEIAGEIEGLAPWVMQESMVLFPPAALQLQWFQVKELYSCFVIRFDTYLLACFRICHHEQGSAVVLKVGGESVYKSVASFRMTDGDNAEIIFHNSRVRVLMIIQLPCVSSISSPVM